MTWLAPDDSTVTFNDVLPVISVVKTANPTHVAETGGDVVFTFAVSNDGTESVTLTSLTDDKYGDITQVQGQVSGTTCVPDNNAATCEIEHDDVGLLPPDERERLVVARGLSDHGEPGVTLEQEAERGQHESLGADGDDSDRLGSDRPRNGARSLSPRP